MTALQSLILAAIRNHGPQSITSLWHHTKCQPLAGVIVAIGELSDSGLIEKFPNAIAGSRIPEVMRAGRGYWQLTEKGLQHIAANAAACNATQLEVEIGSE